MAYAPDHRACYDADSHIMLHAVPHEDVGNLIEQSNTDLYLFSSDYPHIEGTRDPIARFERSLEAASETVKTRFYSENFLRLWPEARIS